MKKIINGLLYDTDQSELVCHCLVSDPAGSIKKYTRGIYLSKNKRFFLFLENGVGGDLQTLAVSDVLRFAETHNLSEIIANTIDVPEA